MRSKYLMIFTIVFLMASCSRQEELILTYDTIFGSRADYIENADYVTIIHIDSNEGETDETVIDGIVPLTKLGITVIHNIYGEYNQEYIYQMGGYKSKGNFMSRKGSDIYQYSEPNIIEEGYYVITSFTWGKEYPVIEFVNLLPDYDTNESYDNQNEQIREILVEYQRTFDEKYAEKLEFIQAVGNQIDVVIEQVRANPDVDSQCELITLAYISEDNCDVLLNNSDIIQNNYEIEYSIMSGLNVKIEYDLYFWLITFYVDIDNERVPVLDFKVVYDEDDWELLYTEIVRDE